MWTASGDLHEPAHRDMSGRKVTAAVLCQATLEPQMASKAFLSALRRKRTGLTLSGPVLGQKKTWKSRFQSLDYEWGGTECNLKSSKIWEAMSSAQPTTWKP